MSEDIKSGSRRPIVAIIQARMSSIRLPGKIMAKICDRPILWHVCNRLKRASLVDEIVVATSINAEDDLVARACVEWGVNTFRGSLDDVLDRYYSAASASSAVTIVRITADCPLIDPVIIDSLIEKFSSGAVDLLGLDSTFPDGLDTEVFSFSALERTWKEARLASEREHVTPYMINNPQLFKTLGISNDKDLSHMRWTVDDPFDLEFVTAVYEAFDCREELFFSGEILELLEKRPELLLINSGTKRNEGYEKSIREDHVLEPRDIN